MGFALELENAGNSGMPQAWNVPPPAAPRHRKPARRRRPGLTGLAQATAGGAAATARWARTVITTRPALADHRRAF
jgi:hypothetical protein